MLWHSVHRLQILPPYNEHEKNVTGDVRRHMLESQIDNRKRNQNNAKLPCDLIISNSNCDGLDYG